MRHETTARVFKRFDRDQTLLMPPNLNDWLPEKHLARFVVEMVERFDLSEFYAAYEDVGHPPYDPKMMVPLLTYGYCVGVRSSRRIEKATYEDLAFRYISADQHPDHSAIAEFRTMHREALERIFDQVLALCIEIGMVKLGRVALDGVKIKANASKHKAMSYDHMLTKKKELEDEIRRISREMLDDADRSDAEEDAKYGKGKRGDELPEELQFRKNRLAKIEKAMKELEEEARRKAEQEGKDDLQKCAQPVDVAVDPKAQRNFTDPDSRIMPVRSGKDFIQGYNGQAAVDDQEQVIVAADLVQDTNDKRQLIPMLDQVKENTGRMPDKACSDNGFCSEAALRACGERGVDMYVATGKIKHGKSPPDVPRGRIPNGLTLVERMARKLRTRKGREEYAKRKGIVEPVFGQIEHARGIRQLLLRGLEKARMEWKFICATHNILKVFKRWLSGSYRPAPG